MSEIIATKFFQARTPLLIRFYRHLSFLSYHQSIIFKPNAKKRVAFIKNRRALWDFARAKIVIGKFI